MEAREAFVSRLLSTSTYVFPRKLNELNKTLNSQRTSRFLAGSRRIKDPIGYAYVSLGIRIGLFREIERERGGRERERGFL